MHSLLLMSLQEAPVEKEGAVGSLYQHHAHLPLHWRAATGLQAEKDWEPVWSFTKSAWHAAHPELKQLGIVQDSYLHYLAQGRSCSIRQEIPAENPPLQLQLLVMSFLHRENIGITIFHALQLPIWKHCSFLSSFLRFSPQNFLRAAPASSGGNLASTNVSRKPAMTLMGSLFHSVLGGSFAWVSAAGHGPRQARHLSSSRTLLLA